LSKHQRYIILFALVTGLRQSNVVGLHWEQVNLDEGIAWIYRQQFGKHSKAVFTYQGHFIKQVNMKAWHKALKDVGIEDFRWHDLRHIWVPWLAMNGANLLKSKS
jgi:integrase